jgi:hypothetical protein
VEKVGTDVAFNFQLTEKHLLMKVINQEISLAIHNLIAVI